MQTVTAASFADVWKGQVQEGLTNVAEQEHTAIYKKLQGKKREDHESPGRNFFLEQVAVYFVHPAHGHYFNVEFLLAESLLVVFGNDDLFESKLFGFRYAL